MLPVRLMLGVIFFVHGAQKLLGWFGGDGLTNTAQLFGTEFGLHPGWLWTALAAVAEFFGALSVCTGLLTRGGAGALACVMATAILKVHGHAFFNPDGVEYPLALLGASLVLLIYGGGRLSVDHVMLRPDPHQTGAPAPAPTPAPPPARVPESL